MQSKQHTTLIGIWGVHSGAGVTTMTIAFANYLAGFLGKTVAVYEYSHKNDFARIYDSIYSDGNQIIDKSFVYEKVTYFIKSGTTIKKLLSAPHDVVIVDFGSSTFVPDEFMICMHKIVLSSMEPWYCGKYEEFCKNLKNYEGSNMWLHIIGSDVKDVKQMKRKFGIMAVERPNIRNSYVIDKSVINFFQSLY